MSAELLFLLGLGMANGLLHALDADHILAVSAVALSGQRGREKRDGKVLRTALLWALGHGVSLICLVAMAVGLGWAIPEALSRGAELLVGVILIAIGGSIVLRLWRGTIRITRHHHSGLPPHTHIHNPGHEHRSDHRPVLVGIVHGIAGSAPLLAVLPLMIRQEFIFVALYVLLFSACVAAMMCAFGGGLGSVARMLEKRTASGIKWLQGTLGIQALVMGAYWLYAAI